MGTPDDLSLPCTPSRIFESFPGVSMWTFPSSSPTHGSWKEMENEARSQTSTLQPGVNWYDFRGSIYPRTIVPQGLEAIHSSCNVCVPFAVPLTCHHSAFMHTP